MERIRSAVDVLRRPEVVEEIKLVFKLSGPISLTYFAQLAMYLVVLHFVGQLGPVSLGGTALGIMFCNCTGYAVVFGMAGALDTLLYQAYGADRRSPILSVYMQRGLLVGLACCGVVAVTWLLVEPLLLLLHQDPEIVQTASTYVHWSLVALFPAIAYEIIRKFLCMLEDVVFASIWAFCVTTFLVPVAAYLLVSVSGLGVVGAPMCIMIGFSSVTLGCIAYLRYTGHSATYWHGFSRAALKDWKEYLSLGVPTTLMLLSEWGSMEVNGMLSGYLGLTSLDAYLISMQMMGNLYVVPMGVGVGTCVRVGAHLGARDVTGAKQTALAGAAVTMCIISVFVPGLLLLRHTIPRMFTDDEAVIDMYATLTFTLAIYYAICATTAFLNGLVRALGRQKYGFYILLFSYALGLPTGWGLAFGSGLGVTGLCMGPTLGVAIGLALYIVLFTRVDWDQAAAEAAARLHTGHESLQMGVSTVEASEPPGPSVEPALHPIRFPVEGFVVLKDDDELSAFQS